MHRGIGYRSENSTWEDSGSYLREEKGGETDNMKECQTLETLRGRGMTKEKR